MGNITGPLIALLYTKRGSIYIAVRMVRHWQKLSREVVHTANLEADWMGLWSIWYSGRYPWLLQGRWTKRPWKAPFQPRGVYGPLILWTATRWRALDILYIYIPMQRFKDSKAGRQLYYPLVGTPEKKGRKFCWKTSTLRLSFLAVPKHSFSEKRHPLFQDFIQECTVSVLKVFKWLFKIHTSFLIWFLSLGIPTITHIILLGFFYKLFLQTLCLWFITEMLSEFFNFWPILPWAGVCRSSLALVEKLSVLYEFQHSEFLNCILVLKTLIPHLSQFRRGEKGFARDFCH